MKTTPHPRGLAAPLVTLRSAAWRFVRRLPPPARAFLSTGLAALGVAAWWLTAFSTTPRLSSAEDADATVTVPTLASQPIAPAPDEAPTDEAPTDEALPDDVIRSLREASPRVAIPFVENRGRASDEVRYVVDGAGRTLFFTPSGVTIALRGPSTDADSWAVRLAWTGDRLVEPVAEEHAAARFRYHGARQNADADADDATTRAGSAGAESSAAARSAYRLRYPNLWPGIDLVFVSEPGEVKYQFEVAPGADPRAIRLMWEGAASLAIERDGVMLVETPAGSLRDAAPVAWHPDGASAPRRAVEAVWQLGAAADDRQEFGVTLGDYDAARPLVIDPALFVSCGYLGGAAENFTGPVSQADEAITDVVVDPQGRITLCGWTTSTSTSFPVRVGPIVEAAGDRDAFVARLDPTGTRIEFCSFLGGENRDEAYGVAIDDTGSTYIVGYTLSDETTFPVRIGPALTYHGDGDGFIARIDHEQRLDHCGYLGTSAVDWVASIAVDPDNLDTIVVGTTRTGELPTRGGPDTTYNGSLDAFVGRLEFGGFDYRWLGYLGGIYDDVATDVAIDALGRAHVVGATWSDETTFPVAVGPDLTYNHPVAGFTRDAFVATVSMDGRTLDACGYIGGVGWDSASAIALDAHGAAIVVGDTLSDESSFPVRTGPVTTFAGAIGVLGDAFVARVTPDATELSYCGYLGSSGGDAAYGVAVDPATGDAWITGLTYGDDFPTLSGGIGDTSHGGGDAFLSRVSSAGDLTSSGYLGGAGEDIGEAVAFDSLAGSVIVVGSTGSRADTFSVAAGPAVSHAGGHPAQTLPTDGFVTRVIPPRVHDVTVTIDDAPAGVRAGELVRLTITVTNHTDERIDITGWVEGLKPDRSASVRNPILGPRTARLHPGSITRTAELSIPAGTPAQGPIELRVVIGPDENHASHFATHVISIVD